MGGKLPESFRPYLWDVDFEKLDPKKYPEFVLKRIIEHGDSQAFRWALKHYPLKTFKEIVLKSRDISRKTALIWANFLGLEPKNVTTLSRPYTLWERKDQRTFYL